MVLKQLGLDGVDRKTDVKSFRISYSRDDSALWFQQICRD